MEKTTILYGGVGNSITPTPVFNGTILNYEFVKFEAKASSASTLRTCTEFDCGRLRVSKARKYKQK
ncbi:hypothetical protein [Calothrix sp. PCC 6303]|uniref:hypothetical protein n=1 Tax=Calothrix sp. PCC 6303 TaxID=1170562 RepID=UPI0002A02BA0|nr:hypothetical protein [Calothrix sp. PCC 6303]AFY99157.1 hypothetical protein Cal6303_0048 [Calothrix sp. PCC 6303]